MNLRFLILYQPKYPSTNQNSISGGFGLKNWDDKGKIVYDADDNESIVRHHLETAVINDTETSCKIKYDWDERAFDYCDSELKPGAVCARSFEVWANSSFFPIQGLGYDPDFDWELDWDPAGDWDQGLQKVRQLYT